MKNGKLVRGNGEGGKLGFDCIRWVANDWIVWIDWLSIGLHWIRVAFGCILWIGWLSIGLHWMRVAFGLKLQQFTYLF